MDSIVFISGADCVDFLRRQINRPSQKPAITAIPPPCASAYHQQTPLSGTAGFDQDDGFGSDAFASAAEAEFFGGGEFYGNT